MGLLDGLDEGGEKRAQIERHATKVLAALDPGARWPPLLALLQRASSAAAAAPSKKRRGGAPDAADLAGALARAARDDDAATGGGRASGVWEADDDAALDADRSHAVAWEAAAACGAVGGASADGARAAVELFVTFLRVDLFDDGGDPDAKDGTAVAARDAGLCNLGNTCYMNATVQALADAKRGRSGIWTKETVDDTPWAGSDTESDDEFFQDDDEYQSEDDGYFASHKAASASRPSRWALLESTG